MRSPTSAFATIRDNENKYFVQSIGIFIFVIILGVFPSVFLDETSFTGMGYISPSELDVVRILVFDVTSAIVFAVLLYFIGKNLGGNDNWKKVLSVVFHTYVILIPFYIIISILLFLTILSFTEVFQFNFEEFDEDQFLSMLDQLSSEELDILDDMEPLLDEIDDEVMSMSNQVDELMPLLVDSLIYVGMLIVTIIVFVVWYFVITVKAIKTLNGFDTAKSFGLVILATIITLIFQSFFIL